MYGGLFDDKNRLHRKFVSWLSIGSAEGPLHILRGFSVGWFYRRATTYK